MRMSSSSRGYPESKMKVGRSVVLGVFGYSGNTWDIHGTCCECTHKIIMASVCMVPAVSAHTR